MYSEHFRCDIVHSLDMGRWNCWRHLWFRYRIDMLLCGEYLYIALFFRSEAFLCFFISFLKKQDDDNNIFQFHRLDLHKSNNRNPIWDLLSQDKICVGL